MYTRNNRYENPIRPNTFCIDEDRMGLEDCEESGLITHRGMSPQPNAKCKLANYVQTNDMWLQ